MTTLGFCQGHLEMAPVNIKFLWTLLNRACLGADGVLWFFYKNRKFCAAKDFQWVYCLVICTLIIHGNDWNSEILLWIKSVNNNRSIWMHTHDTWIVFPPPVSALAALWTKLVPNLTGLWVLQERALRGLRALCTSYLKTFMLKRSVELYFL